MPSLFDPITIRSLTLRNRIVLSPMCQYSAVDGHANDWHLVHLGARAVGGAGLVLTEDTAVLRDGRISDADLGLWDDSQIAPLARIADFVHAQGAAFGVQLGYAGRKGSTTVPWRGGRPRGEGRALTEAEGAWETYAPSALPFGGGRSQVPHEMSVADIRRVQEGFVEAARRAGAAGADVVEFHAGWGYIFQQFYSPVSNHRTDGYGGSFENRVRFMLETARAVRKVWSEEKPLFARIALTDWVEGGWTVEDAVQLAAELRKVEVDLVDGISGAIVEGVYPPHATTGLLHEPLIRQVREKAGIATGANFGIETPKQANDVIESGAADVVVIGRAMLADPYWARHAADALGHGELLYPNPYEHWLTGRRVE